jgi:predicted dithiol-disulfide oxidoreductase (DUF899 family)
MAWKYIWLTTMLHFQLYRAPLAKLQAYKRRMGWTFPWASSLDSDFNFDLNVWFTEEQQREGGIEYNYEREKVTGDSLAGKAARK